MLGTEKKLLQEGKELTKSGENLHKIPVSV
jgi:hypothetical protein